MGHQGNIYLSQEWVKQAVAQQTADQARMARARAGTREMAASVGPMAPPPHPPSAYPRLTVRRHPDENVWVFSAHGYPDVRIDMLPLSAVHPNDRPATIANMLRTHWRLWNDSSFPSPSDVVRATTRSQQDPMARKEWEASTNKQRGVAKHKPESPRAWLSRRIKEVTDRAK